MFTVIDARDLARRAHAGQKDQQGRDYFTHHLAPIAAALEAYGDPAVIAGWLHDIVEDHPEYTLDRLRSLGVPYAVVRAIDSVTRRENETYDDLITRSCADPIGVLVKLADNAHNIASNPSLAVIDLPKAQRLLIKRYVPARARLIEARLRHELCGGAPTVPPARAEPPSR